MSGDLPWGIDRRGSRTTVLFGPRAISQAYTIDDSGSLTAVPPLQCGHNDLLRVGEARDRSWDCKLSKDHEGAHDPHANWRGRLEITRAQDGLDVEIRHDHGFTSLRIRSMAQAEAVISAIRDAATEAFGGTS